MALIRDFFRWLVADKHDAVDRIVSDVKSVSTVRSIRPYTVTLGGVEYEVWMSDDTAEAFSGFEARRKAHIDSLKAELAAYQEAATC